MRAQLRSSAFSSLSNRATASVTSPTSMGFTINPVLSCTTASFAPPLFPATDGTPASAASKKDDSKTFYVISFIAHRQARKTSAAANQFHFSCIISLDRIHRTRVRCSVRCLLKPIKILAISQNDIFNILLFLNSSPSLAALYQSLFAEPDA
jgi:hypothetical protein